ncbi:SH3 domain protein [Necator americanus]|uniref:SH3 domain protein n=1 Tax=Necator americanus TaxID=51031 RepID=W2TAN7_NECAM|nr:SH3 domain protein [Necator americanus]ETN78246.1 SH3 domain protein [Necator americanus]
MSRSRKLQKWVSHLPPHPQPRIERRAMSSASSSPESRGVSGAVVPARSATGDAQFRSNAAKSQTRGAAVVDSVFIVLASLKAAESGDLTINEGERLRIVQTRPDGWWTAQNASGKTGLVPKTYLRQLTAADDENGVRDYSAEQRTRAARTVSGSSADVPQPNSLAVEQIPRRARCLGDAQQLDPHLSFACHLTPRLSHSNIGFHDLYWNYQDDKLRKRRVRVSKLVRLIRLEGMPKESAISLIRTALYDRSRKTGRQIVGYSLNARLSYLMSLLYFQTDTTSSGVDYGDFIVRSNYNMDDVVLLIEASHVVQGQEGLEERSLGIITIPLIANDTVVITNK